MYLTKHLSAVTALIGLILCTSARADEPKRLPTRELLAYGLLGGATALFQTTGNWSHDDPQFRRAGGGGISFRIYFTRHAAFHFGVGMMGKGYMDKQVESGWDGAVSVENRVHFYNAELPLGLHFRFAKFHMGVDMVTTAVVTEFVKIKRNDQTSISTRNDQYTLRKQNFCPRVSLEIEVPMGGISLVPGVLAEMDIIDIVYEDDLDLEWRHVNIMGSLGILFGY